MSHSVRSVAISATLGAALVFAFVAGCSGGDSTSPPGPAHVAQVEITPASASVIVGATTTLAVTLRDAAGNALTGRTVSWSSENAALASVSDGMVTGMSAGGPVTIFATSEGKSASASIIVTPPPVETVTVTPAAAAVAVGATTQLSAELKDAGGNVLTGRTVSWSTSAPAKATVSSAGLVTGVAAGPATITATSEGKTSTATITVTATATPVATVTVTPGAPTVVAGSTVQLTAVTRDASNNVLTGRSVTWSTSDMTKATVSSVGLVSGVAVGTSTITATSEGKTASVTVSVTAAPVPVASVTVTPAMPSVAVGATVQLSAVTKDAANNVLTGRTIAWSSSDQTKATVSSTGLVTGVAAGSATITATSEGKSASVTATVTAAAVPVASISIYPGGTTLLPAQTWQLTSTTKSATGTVLTGRVVTWSTSNGGAASVSSSGLVTAVAPGTATITATSEGKSASVIITITATTSSVLQVGPTRTYKKPCAAIAAAKGGETIEIDAATYTADVCVIAKPGLTLRGVGGRPKLDAGGTSAEGKAIWVIRAANTVVENVEFANTKVVDNNGAGIKSEWGNLTVRDCLFDHNQFGILTGYDSTATTLIDGTEFAYQGTATDPDIQHSMYINTGTFILQRSYSHHASDGNLVKTRSRYIYILYNRISSENGTSSYEIDIPNGGRAYIIGNVIQQGAQSTNRWMIEFGAEGVTAGHDDKLFVVNNTIVNDVGTAYGIYIANWVQTPAVVRNNIFGGPFNTITNQATAVLQSNHLPADGDPKFVNPAGYDYRLQATSPAIDKGIAPGTAFGYDMTPHFEYVHPLQNVARTQAGAAIDRGAYEYHP